MAAVMSGFKDGRQVIVPVPLEFTGINTVGKVISQWTFPLITKISIWTKISSQLERASQN
jgi:hypothetical protein